MEKYGTIDSCETTCYFCNKHDLVKLNSENYCKICNVLICKNCTVIYSSCFKKDIYCKTCYKASPQKNKCIIN